MTARVRVRRADNGVYVGSLTLGCPDCGGVGDTNGDGVITVGAFGSSQADAVHKAALLAERIASDPVMSAILPPGTLAAIKATKKLAGAAKQGSRFVRKWFRKFKGPGVKRLAKSLHHEAASAEGVGDVEGLWSGMKKVAKAGVKYGTPAGWGYMAAKKAVRTVKRKPARKRKMIRHVPASSRAAQSSEPPMTDEDIMNTPSPEDIAPMPEDALGPMNAPYEYTDEDQGGEYVDE